VISRTEERFVKAYRADRAFDGDRVLPDGALVLVDGDTIAGVEPASAHVPDGCEVTYLPGTTLLPGLIDVHVHLCADGGPDALDRIPGLLPAELDGVITAALEAQLAAGVRRCATSATTGSRWSRDGFPTSSPPGHPSRAYGGTAGRWAARRAARTSCGGPYGNERNAAPTSSRS
jgi:hypothetical protein